MHVWHTHAASYAIATFFLHPIHSWQTKKHWAQLENTPIAFENKSKNVYAYNDAHTHWRDTGTAIPSQLIDFKRTVVRSYITFAL